MNVRTETQRTDLVQFASERVMFGKIRKLYFVGIGGSGMSGIAEILHNLGFEISGSDHTASEITEYLAGRGITIYPGHRAENLADTEVVVISSAVGEDNPEVVEARRRGIPVIKRAEMLGELMRLKFSVGVAGTHGKTTTTSMIGRILRTGQYKPTIIVGGIVAELGTGASLGEGEYLVAEADEFDRSFLSMFPSMAVVTNLEPDHLDCYDDFDHLVESFLTYMNRVPFFGSVVLSADNEHLWRLRERLARPFVTFGFAVEADYRALNVKMEPGRSEFAVYRRGEYLGDVILHVTGEHNIANALAAVAACSELDVPFEIITDALRGFTGVGRRFEIIGEANGIMVVDDYAHHPTEVRTTLTTAKEVYNRRVIVVFQPHLYSRTRDFYKEFAEALAIADECLLVDIYPARERPIEGVTSELIMAQAQKNGATGFACIGPRDNAAAAVTKIARPGDMVIVMGAGAITHERKNILEALRNLK